MTRNKNAVGIWVVISILSLGVTAAHAGGLSFAAQAGMGFARSSFTVSSVDEDRIRNKFRPVFSGGVTVDWAPPGPEAFSIESGVLFRMKGGYSDLVGEATTEEGAATEQTFRTTWKLAYLCFPLLARVSFPGAPVTPYLKIGPELGIPLAGSMEQANAPSLGGPEDRASDIKDIMTSTELSLAIAAGIGFRIGERAAFAELGYSHGLTDVLETDSTLRNRTAGLAVGIRL